MESKNSNKRSKPSQFMAILGITAILFIIGIFGWLFLSAKKSTELLKENVLVQVNLHYSANDNTTGLLRDYISSQPYVIDMEYVDKETARKRLQATDDRYNEELLGGENPLYASINFHVKNEYVNKDSLIKIKSNIETNGQNIVESVIYPESVVEKIGPVVKYVLIGFVVLAVIFTLLAIVLIDNTIKLSMYSNRFLIKTMQMVGATRGFIVRPINKLAVINALIASFIAIALIITLVLLTESVVPDIKPARDNVKLLYLFTGMIVMGVLISLLSTHRSVIKYLKMKLDDLY
jgi:cell division transport system permease protein